MDTVTLVAVGALAMASNITATILFRKIKKKGLIKCEHATEE